MEIKIRRICSAPGIVERYAEVQIKEGGTQIDLGLLTADERRALAATLLEAADDLLQGLTV